MLVDDLSGVSEQLGENREVLRQATMNELFHHEVINASWKDIKSTDYWKKKDTLERQNAEIQHLERQYWAQQIRLCGSTIDLHQSKIQGARQSDALEELALSLTTHSDELKAAVKELGKLITEDLRQHLDPNKYEPEANVLQTVLSALEKTHKEQVSKLCKTWKSICISMTSCFQFMNATSRSRSRRQTARPGLRRANTSRRR